MTSQAAVFLDRDNTLIANDGDLGDPAGVRLLDGVSQALLRLRASGYRLVVVSNQGGVARGVFGEADVEAVNARIADLLAGDGVVIDRFYFCPYHPQGSVFRYRREHPWRKPQPGMLLQAKDDLDLDLAASWMIGDQPRDIEAGHAAGCKTILVARDPALLGETRPTATTATLAEAADVVLEPEHPNHE